MTHLPDFVAPLKSLKVSRHQIPAYQRLPNTSIQRRPLYVYHQAFNPNTSASDIERHLSTLNVVNPQWRYTMYSESHFHSTTHEVLCVYSGSADLCFGGEENPERVEPRVTKGDVIVVPAGTAHRLMKDYDGCFSMVGCYPKGLSWDMCYGKAGEEEKVKGIKDLPWFESDPIYGDQGPVLGFMHHYAQGRIIIITQ